MIVLVRQDCRPHHDCGSMDRDINVVFLAELSSTKGGLFQAHDESVNKMAGSHRSTGAPDSKTPRIR